MSTCSEPRPVSGTDVAGPHFAGTSIEQTLRTSQHRRMSAVDDRAPKTNEAVEAGGMHQLRRAHRGAEGSEACEVQSFKRTRGEKAFL